MRRLNTLLYNWVDKKFLGGCSSYNNLDVRKSCRSKLQARQAFADYSIPHAKGTTFLSFSKPLSFAKEHGFPLVVKPNVSGFSRGSHFPITNYKELFAAILFAKCWWPVSVVEQYLEGKNYRVVVVKDDIMSVIRRYPPFVIGDGLSTIDTLVDQENLTRKSMQLEPVIHPIDKGQKIKKYLQKQGLSFTSVPPKGEYVQLFNKVALAPGGVVEIVDKKTIAPENTELFIKTLSVFKANILGIDAIFTEGIEVPYKKQKTIFLEVNSRPYLKMHDYPRFGAAEDLSGYYKELEKLQIDQQDVF